MQVPKVGLFKHPPHTVGTYPKCVNIFLKIYALISNGARGLESGLY